jgi:adenylate cyclase
MVANVAAFREDAGMDFEAAGLLDDLDGEARKQRKQLLERLAEDGFTLEELKDAAAENRLALLPVDRVLGGIYTATEVEERTGLPAELLIRIRRLAGLPDSGREDVVFAEEDVELAASTKEFIDAGFSEEAIFEITRVLGEGMSRLAATVVAGFTEAFLEPGAGEQEVGDRFAALAEQFIPTVTPILVSTFKAHLRESVKRGMLSRAELEAGKVADAQELTVCFADLVGFTRLGGEIALEDLGSLAGQLAHLASDVTEEPVRLVKTIGDAAMFVSPEPKPLVMTALRLVDAVKDAELPSLRAGIALGPATARAGDFYGPSVNLASRVTGIARAESVLCTQEVRDATEEAFDWSSAGKHKLKGVSKQVALSRARLRQHDGSSEDNDGARRGKGKRKRS